MVTPQELFMKLQLKVNKNATASNRALTKPIAVNIINDVKNRWVNQSLKDKDSILVDNLWSIVKDVNLTQKTNYNDRSEFSLNPDFYQLVRAEGLCKKDLCKKVIFFREVKGQDVNILKSNDSLKPDFDFEWSFMTLGDGKLIAYKDGFDIENLRLWYYKIIPDIDIAGYRRIDGSASTDIGLDLETQYVDQIINLAAEEFMRNYGDDAGLRIAKDRTINQE